MNLRARHNGSALIACTILLVVISVLAIALCGISAANLQMADNQRWGNQAFASAESGLEVMRYWLSRVRMPSSTAPSDYLSSTIALVQSDLADNEIASFIVNDDGSIPAVLIDPNTGQNFQGQWSADPGNPTILRVTVTGRRGLMSRTISVEFNITPYRFPIFNYGMALKGPLVLPYNPRFYAATESWEADIYVESANSMIAVDIGKNATFAGNIDIGNPDASVTCGGTLDLGGEIRQIAPEDRPEFPVPKIRQDFYDYATGPVITATTDLSGATTTWANARIAADSGTEEKPLTFGGNVIIQGILYIEAPNIVMFPKNITLEGMIVAEGDVNNPGTNAINFGDPSQPKVPSNFTSGPYPPGPQFDAIRQEQGSCILAPGFAVSFWKNFTAINGVIAASGLHFDNNASATVKGTLINYSEDPLDVTRNINLTFDRSGMVEIPAGFDLYRVLQYNPSSYTLAF